MEAERDLARRYQLVATPALVIDGAIVLYGISRAAHADPGAP